MEPLLGARRVVGGVYSRGFDALRTYMGVVVATLKEVRGFWAHFRCIHTSGQTLGDARMWGHVRGPTPPECVDAWAALEKTLTAHGYGTPAVVSFQRRCPTGIAGQPCQGSGEDCSLHNYGLAVDIDPLKNPHFHRAFGDDWDFSNIRLTRPQVEAVEALETASGARIFRWLGWTEGDTMHFEINCPPVDMKSGVGPLFLTELDVILEGESMTPTQARLEIAAGWHSRTGQWMSRDSDETAQERLTRLSLDVAEGRRTVDDILKFAGEPRPQKGEPVPAWVLDPFAAETS